MLTQSELKKHFYYDAETGVFTRLTSVSSNAKKGDIAGSKCGHGYLLIAINKKRYMAHRLAWLYVYGEWPKGCVDHINHIKNDNSISNLRDVSYKGNSTNMPRNTLNTSGLTGVYWHKVKEKWQACIGVDGDVLYLGYFLGKFEAACARKSAENEYGFHENHGI